MSFSLKLQLHTLALAKLEGQIQDLEQGLSEVRAVANSQQKSSAGDKHETTRAMAHLEQERYAQLLREAFAVQHQLVALEPVRLTDEAELGAMIVTDTEVFYIAAAVGPLEVNGQRCWVISPQAPLADALEGLEVGDTVHFRGQPLEILGIS